MEGDSAGGIVIIGSDGSARGNVQCGRHGAAAANSDANDNNTANNNDAIGNADNI